MTPEEFHQSQLDQHNENMKQTRTKIPEEVTRVRNAATGEVKVNKQKLAEDLNDLLNCECETKFSIEKHGENYALCLGRCNHKHGYNLFTISDVAYNCDLKSIENKLNEK